MADSDSSRLLLTAFKNYKPPKQLRALFILHYMPLLLSILIGPITPLTGCFSTPLHLFLSIFIGIIIFLYGATIYLRWELHWEQVYHGQLVTSGIFKSIRHPHYASLLIINYGLAFFFNSILCLLLATLALPIMVLSVLDEEKLLLKQYGKDYETFMKSTPYRLIPKLF